MNEEINNNYKESEIWNWDNPIRYQDFRLPTENTTIPITITKEKASDINERLSINIDELDIPVEKQDKPSRRELPKYIPPKKSQKLGSSINYGIGVDPIHPIGTINTSSAIYNGTIGSVDSNVLAFKDRNKYITPDDLIIKEKFSVTKSEEIIINYNELAGDLATEYLKEKYSTKYDEVGMVEEWIKLNEKYINIILKYKSERN